MTETNNDLMRGRAYHADPRELILMAAERTGLLHEVGAMMHFLSKHAPEGPCSQDLLLNTLIENLSDVSCPTPTDLFGPGYEGFNPPYLVNGETMADLKTYLKQFPLPASGGWEKPQKGEVK